MISGLTPEEALRKAATVRVDVGGETVPAALLMAMNLAGLGEANLRLCSLANDEERFAVVITAPEVIVDDDTAITSHMPALRTDERDLVETVATVILPYDRHTGLYELRSMPVVLSHTATSVIGVVVPKIHLGDVSEFVEVDNWHGLGAVHVVGARLRRPPATASSLPDSVELSVLVPRGARVV